MQIWNLLAIVIWTIRLASSQTIIPVDFRQLTIDLIGYFQILNSSTMDKCGKMRTGLEYISHLSQEQIWQNWLISGHTHKLPTLDFSKGVVNHIVDFDISSSEDKLAILNIQNSRNQVLIYNFNAGLATSTRNIQSLTLQTPTNVFIIANTIIKYYRKNGNAFDKLLIIDQNGTVINSYVFTHSNATLIFTPDEGLALAWTPNSQVFIYETSRFDLLFTFNDSISTQEDRTNFISVSPDSTLAFIEADSYAPAVIFDLVNLRILLSFTNLYEINSGFFVSNDVVLILGENGLSLWSLVDNTVTQNIMLSIPFTTMLMDQINSLLFTCSNNQISKYSIEIREPLSARLRNRLMVSLNYVMTTDVLIPSNSSLSTSTNLTIQTNNSSNTSNLSNSTNSTNATNATNATNVTNAMNSTNSTNTTNATNITNLSNSTNTTNFTNANATLINNSTNLTNSSNILNNTDLANSTNATNASYVSNATNIINVMAFNSSNSSLPLNATIYSNNSAILINGSSNATNSSNSLNNTVPMANNTNSIIQPLLDDPSVLNAQQALIFESIDMLLNSSTSQLLQSMVGVAGSSPLAFYALSFLNFVNLSSLYIFLQEIIPERLNEYLSMIYLNISKGIMNILGIEINIKPIATEKINNEKMLVYGMTSDFVISSFIPLVLIVFNICLGQLVYKLGQRIEQHSFLHSFLLSARFQIICGQLIEAILSFIMPWIFVIYDGGLYFSDKINSSCWLLAIFFCLIFPCLYLIKIIMRKQAEYIHQHIIRKNRSNLQFFYWNQISEWLNCLKNVIYPLSVTLCSPITFLVCVGSLSLFCSLAVWKSKKQRINNFILSLYPILYHGCFVFFYVSTEEQMMGWGGIAAICLLLGGSAHHLLTIIVKLLIFIFQIIKLRMKFNTISVDPEMKIAELKMRKILEFTQMKGDLNKRTCPQLTEKKETVMEVPIRNRNVMRYRRVVKQVGKGNALFIRKRQSYSYEVRHL